MVVTKNPVILEGTIKKEEQAEEERGTGWQEGKRRKQGGNGWDSLSSRRRF